MSAKMNKNNKEYPLGFMPEHYPADRVYLDGDINKTVQDECVRKTGGRMSGDLTIVRADGTTSAVGNSTLTLGNNIPEGTAGNSRGYILMYGKTDKRVVIRDNNPNGFTANRDINIPDKSGTFSLYENAVKLNSNIDVYLYRNGNLRTLDIRGAKANEVVGLTIPLGDRPVNNQIFSIVWFGFIGRLAINSDGSINLGHYQNYGVNTLSNDDTSTVTVRATVTWAVS